MGGEELGRSWAEHWEEWWGVGREEDGPHMLPAMLCKLPVSLRTLCMLCDLPVTLCVLSKGRCRLELGVLLPPLLCCRFERCELPQAEEL